MTARTGVTIEGRDLVVRLNPRDVLELASPADILSLVDDLACEDAVIEMVTDQIVEGWTKLESHGARGCDGRTDSALEKATRRVAEMSGEVAKTEIDRLVRALEAANQRLKTEEARYIRVVEWVESRGARIPLDVVMGPREPT